jgi:beta-xylosidase
MQLGQTFRDLIRTLVSSPRDAAPKQERERQQEWSIGIYVGHSPFHFTSPDTVHNPVLTRASVSDIAAAFVADPFMLKVNRTWYLFCEVMNKRTHKGEIGLATSRDEIEWTYQQIVLSEPFHLSYPYVFRWKSEFYMVPESYQANAVRLYKAVDFPTRWSFVQVLIEGPDCVDPSIFYFDKRWWLFVGGGTPPVRADHLRLYYAEELTGPWFPHPKSPIVEGDAHIARPAGRVVVLNDRILRYSQDCYPTYGTQVHAFEITDLTTTSYHERETDRKPILTAGQDPWNEGGMHHIDPHSIGDNQWIACVDGFAWR